MTKRINLFNEKRRSALSPELAQNIRVTETVMAVVFCAIFGILAIVQVQQKRTYETLLSQKKDLIEYQQDNQARDLKVGYLIQKDSQFQEYSKDDAQFVPYYNLLKELLNVSSDSGQLEDMTLDKSKSTQFTIRFNTYEPTFEFLRYVESETFLKNFVGLTLNSFSLVSDDSSARKGYELSFKGKFKIIDETTTAQ
jgi:hypothetical protein